MSESGKQESRKFSQATDQQTPISGIEFCQIISRAIVPDILLPNGGTCFRTSMNEQKLVPPTQNGNFPQFLLSCLTASVESEQPLSVAIAG